MLVIWKRVNISQQSYVAYTWGYDVRPGLWFANLTPTWMFPVYNKLFSVQLQCINLTGMGWGGGGGTNDPIAELKQTDGLSLNSEAHCRTFDWQPCQPCTMHVQNCCLKCAVILKRQHAAVPKLLTCSKPESLCMHINGESACPKSLQAFNPRVFAVNPSISVCS